MSERSKRPPRSLPARRARKLPADQPQIASVGLHALLGEVRIFRAGAGQQHLPKRPAARVSSRPGSEPPAHPARRGGMVPNFQLQRRAARPDVVRFLRLDNGVDRAESGRPASKADRAQNARRPPSPSGFRSRFGSPGCTSASPRSGLFPRRPDRLQPALLGLPRCPIPATWPSPACPDSTSPEWFHTNLLIRCWLLSVRTSWARPTGEPDAELQPFRLGLLTGSSSSPAQCHRPRLSAGCHCDAGGDEQARDFLRAMGRRFIERPHRPPRSAS